MFVATVAVDNAVTTFTSIGEVDPAIDVYAKMIDYAQTPIDNGKRAAAVDFYVRAGLFDDTAKLLLKEGTPFHED